MSFYFVSFLFPFHLCVQIGKTASQPAGAGGPPGPPCTAIEITWRAQNGLRIDENLMKINGTQQILKIF